MPIRKLDLSPDADEVARRLATDQGIRVEALLERRLEADLRGGAHRARLFAWRILCWWAPPIATAFIVVCLLAAAHGITTAYSQDTLFLTALHWIRVAFISMFPWPFTILAIVVVVFGSSYAFANLLDLVTVFRKFKFAGTEIELNERTKSKLLTASSEINAAIQEYRTRVDHEVARLVSRHRLAARLSRYSDQVIIQRYGRNNVGAGYRCTIHIQDPISDGNLYQLLDYHPVGEGQYRLFSDRYGIIGKVWRTERSLIFNDVGGLPAAAPMEARLESIMSNWGMSRREAEKALRRPSSICLLLEHHDEKVGIMYIDSDIPDAFPNTPDAELDRLRTAANVELSSILDEIIDELSSLKLGLNLSP